MRKKAFWMKWVQPTEDWKPRIFPPDPAVLGCWQSGQAAGGELMVCAMVFCEDIMRAKDIIQEQSHWPGAGEFRFATEYDDHEFYLGDRFNIEPWMEERFRHARKYLHPATLHTPEEYCAAKEAEERRHCEAMRTIEEQWATLEFPKSEELRPATAADVVVGRIFYYPVRTVDNVTSIEYWAQVARVDFPHDDFKAYLSECGCFYGLQNAHVRKEPRT